MSRPAIVLAMEPSRTEHVLPDGILRRLDTIGRLLDPEPLQRLEMHGQDDCFPKPKSW
ncbi:hypothetical protein GGI59_005111 [Rhizobium lentis]|uniref:Uncharacterized protein n=1 Tax=Rhizobium lentis TaxID=1138194 RepID=A0A7W8XIG2_9HYPH|nr:hypothetical protein [Rhizobium lentis]MBB5553062.1 hypothetical protein [Rhizobium lentis]MBB5563419.1 hypothetical protein [Rhizobium lentis]MBB5569957.1 hypothetical protein [Rhizobium lentis]